MKFEDVKKAFDNVKEEYLHPRKTNYDKNAHLKKLFIIAIVIVVLALVVTVLDSLANKKNNVREIPIESQSIETESLNDTQNASANNLTKTNSTVSNSTNNL